MCNLERDVPGAQVAVAVDGRTIWSAGFRDADIERKLPITATTMSRIGRSPSRSPPMASRCSCRTTSWISTSPSSGTYRPSRSNGGQSRLDSSPVTSPASATTTTRWRAIPTATTRRSSPASRSSPTIRCCSSRAPRSAAQATATVCWQPPWRARRGWISRRIMRTRVLGPLGDGAYLGGLRTA